MNIGRYIKSDHVLIIQDDGHIVNPNKWDSSFLNYDYVEPHGHLVTSGEKDGKELITKMHIKMQKNRVGNGGFSLRSKNFLIIHPNFELQWDCRGCFSLPSKLRKCN